MSETSPDRKGGKRFFSNVKSNNETEHPDLTKKVQPNAAKNHMQNMETVQSDPKCLPCVTTSYANNLQNKQSAPQETRKPSWKSRINDGCGADVLFGGAQGNSPNWRTGRSPAKQPPQQRKRFPIRSMDGGGTTAQDDL